MMTIEDIRNPKRKSGFDHVSKVGGTSTGPGRVYWRAESGPRNTPAARAVAWRGTSRKDPESAAQDYVDYMNGTPATRLTLKSAGHAYNIESGGKDPEVEAALGVLRDAKAQKAGKQGYVYLITDGQYVKIGYSANPKKRVAELQTGNARVLHLVGAVPGTESDERAAQQKFISANVLMEWFEQTPLITSHFKTLPGWQDFSKEKPTSAPPSGATP